MMKVGRQLVILVQALVLPRDLVILNLHLEQGLVQGPRLRASNVSDPRRRHAISRRIDLPAAVDDDEGPPTP